jgi:multimeric flavodoxin WrbA
MKILGLIGSPRKGSNTDLLVSAILEGAGANNHLTEKIYLYDFEIAACVDCRACKKGNFKCALGDSMQVLYPKLEEADVIVFGTPLYWYGPSAKMKLLIDRLRPFIASKKLKGKKAVLAIPSEEGAEACNFTIGMFGLSLEYLCIKMTGKLTPRASERAELKGQPQTLKEAFELGKTLK